MYFRFIILSESQSPKDALDKISTVVLEKQIFKFLQCIFSSW